MPENQTGVLGLSQLEGQPTETPGAGAADQQNLLPGVGEAAAGQRQDTRTVPLAALEDERSKRQLYERDLANLRSQNEFLQSLIQTQQQVAEPAVTDDEYVNAATVKKLVTEAIQPVLGEVRNTKVQSQVEQVRAKHEDFDDVISLAVEMCNKAPDPQAAFKALEAAGPEFAYQFGKTHPKLSQGKTFSEAQERLNKINRNVNQTATLTDVGSAGMVGSFEDQLNRMSRSERDRIWDEIKLGKRSFFQ